LDNVEMGSFWSIFQQKQGEGFKSFTENDYFCIGSRLKCGSRKRMYNHKTENPMDR